jgi:hypothetical protein
MYARDGVAIEVEMRPGALAVAESRGLSLRKPARGRR